MSEVDDLKIMLGSLQGQVHRLSKQLQSAQAEANTPAPAPPPPEPSPVPAPVAKPKPELTFRELKGIQGFVDHLDNRPSISTDYAMLRVNQEREASAVFLACLAKAPEATVDFLAAVVPDLKRFCQRSSLESTRNKLTRAVKKYHG